MADDPVPIRVVAGAFARLGLIAFGGPAAHVALMHRDFVKERKWIDERSFLDNFALTNLIPGPNSTELAMLVGRQAAGLRGLMVAGIAFIVPAAFIVLVLAYAYAEYGATPAGQAIMYGIEPIVIAIVLYALIDLARKALGKPTAILIAVLAAAGYLGGVNELVLLFAGGAAVWLIRASTRGRIALILPPLMVSGGAVEVTLDRLFLVFLKIGAVLYGSGYVLLAFLQGDLVERLGWLTQQQLIDAVAIGQFTPGPVFTTATFVGYVVAGLPGALLATLGIFLPSFFFAALVAHFGPKLRGRRWTAAILDGLTAAALGLMAGVLLQLGRNAIVDPLTALLASAGFILLVSFQTNSAWLIAGGGVVGLLVEVI